MTCLLFASCKNVSITFNTEANDSVKEILSEVAEDYSVAYPETYGSLLVTDTVIMPEINRFDEERLIRAIGENRHIIINQYYLKNKHYTRKEIRDIFTHEMFHTIKSDNAKILGFNNGKLLATSGLIVVTDISVETVMATKTDTLEKILGDSHLELEEAAAEVCAIALYPDYEFTNGYYNMSVLLKGMTDKQYFSPAFLAYSASENNVAILIAKILNKKDKRDVHYEEVLGMIEIFQNLHYNDRANPDKNEYKASLEMIEAQREK